MSRKLTFSGLLQDFRYGVRQMRRNPVLASVVVLSLALGIGANTAIFSLVNAVMLRGLAVRDPGRLVMFDYTEPKGGMPESLDFTQSGRGFSMSWPSFTYMRARVRTLSSLVGFVPLGLFDKPAAIVNGEPMFVDGEMVTANYFPALGVSPIEGRVILPEDENAGAPRVAVISYRFWNRAYARGRGAIGNTITFNGVPVTVVGIAPPSFSGLEVGRSPDMWIQMGPQPGLAPWGKRTEDPPQAVFAAPNQWWLQVVGRLQPGVTVEQARVEFERLFRQSLLATIDTPVAADRLPTVQLKPAAQGLNTLRGRFSTPLSVLTVVVGLVLLVACANVATLLLARATARRREMGIRLAMGAARARLVRQLLTESLVYAALGSTLGLLFAVWGGPALFVLLTQGRDPIPLDVRLDPTVLGFTVAISLLTTMLFGLAPALRATRLDVAVDLKENASTTRGGSGPVRLRGTKLLVVAQVALSVPLVIGAGLFLRTLSNLHHQPLGFDADRILTFRIDPTKAGLKGARLLSAYGDLQERFRALPGVRGVSASRIGLVTGWMSLFPISWDSEPPNLDGVKRTIYWNQVGPGFLETMGMSLLLGRAIDAHDTVDGVQVAVVNEAMARRFFAGRNPIGQRFYFGPTRQGKPIEIIGVVRDAKYSNLRAPAPPTAYVPYTQSRLPLSAMVFEVRAAGDPMALVPGIRTIAGEVVPGVPVGDIKTQARLIDDSLGQETMFVRLFTFFGAMALALACIGLYGTMAYALGRRTREIGIRMALGADRGRVLRSALMETLVVASSGVAAGGLLAWAGARYVRSLLFDVTPLDRATLMSAALIIVTVAILAGYFPARRASRLDPLRALREE